MTLWSTNWQLSHKKLQDFDELQTGVIVQIPTCLLPYVNLSSSYDTSFKELRIDFVINNQHFSKYSQTKAAKKQKKKKTSIQHWTWICKNKSITTRLNKVYKVCNTKKGVIRQNWTYFHSGPGHPKACSFPRLSSFHSLQMCICNTSISSHPLSCSNCWLPHNKRIWIQKKHMLA